MLRIFRMLVEARRQRVPASVHFHVDGNGAEYACHVWECHLGTQRPQLSHLVGPIS